MTHPTANLLVSELEFTASRSSGPGGQNVNKVNSKVTLKFDVVQSHILTGDQKELILHKLKSRITADGVLMINEQESRSQVQNREQIMAKFDDLLRQAFTPVKKRKRTRPGKAAKEKRLGSKKQQAEKKKWRQKL